MHCASENPHLGRRPDGLCDGDPTDVDSEIGEISKELLPLCVIPHGAHREWLCPKSPKIVDRVSASSGHNLGLTMIQDQDWRFTRDSRYFTIDEYIRDQITDYDNAPPFEPVDGLAKLVHTNAPETIDSTAVSKLSATKCGC